MEGRKVRVYELAKELNIDAKELLPILREMGASNPTVMISLDPADARKLKKNFEDRKEKSSIKMEVVETQIKEGVIRRRKVAQKIEEPPAPPEISPAEKEAEEREKSEAEKKKKVLKKKTAPVKKGKENEPAAKETAAEAKAETKPAEPVAPATEEPIPEKKPTGIEILKAPEKVAPKKPKIRLRWIKPTIRKTARADDEIPSKESMAKEQQKSDAEKAQRVEREKKKDKKKKGVKPKSEIEEFVGNAPKGKKIKEPIKRKLRRKIAFKMERGAVEEGMGRVNTDRVYIPQKKKISAKKRLAQKSPITIFRAKKRIVRMGESISVEELSKRMGVKSKLVYNKLNELGIQFEPDTPLAHDQAEMVAREFENEVVQEMFDEATIIKLSAKPAEDGLEPRPPVVTVMGHVDHGKTTLLDYIRKTKVAEKEPGQITQSIGASLVEGPSGKITFIDTPGHAAFTKMRARGAEVTDIVVLVVAADDGVMPQTLEAINHAKAAKVPIVVAINKMDLPDAKPDQIKSRLAEQGLNPEEWGGETLMAACSAKTGKGVDELLEAISLQAEMLDLRGNPKIPARGFVIESKLERGRGTVASIVIKDGTLKRHDAIVCGTYSGRVRALFDHLGRQMESAGPSLPVEVIGLDGVPDAGEKLIVVEDDKSAKIVAEHRAEKRRTDNLTGSVEATMEDLLRKMEQGQKAEINLIIKADTQGALEAVRDAVLKMSTEQVEIKVLHSGPGAITENDVILAETTKSVIIGFGVRPESKAGRIAEEKGVRVSTHRIIYELLDELDLLRKGMTAATKTEKAVGRAEVRQVFNITKVGTIAGCLVQEGVAQRSAQVRVLRDNAVVYEGRIASLKRFKDDAKEVAKGMECGIGIENFNDLKPGDVLEFFIIQEKPAT